MNSLVKVSRSGIGSPIILHKVAPHYESFRRSSSESGGGKKSTDNYYDCRKYSHRLPHNTTFVPFECFAGIPTGVFRTTIGERLGPGADKAGVYKQAEYFCYHHSTFVDMHMYLRGCRQPRIDLKRKPVTF